jgi:hypothetical protein
MGSSLSPILAILFMDNIERQVITSSTLIGLYYRYVDDIFILTQNSTTANQIHDMMNNQHANIKFDIEHPRNNNCLSLLDFEVTIHQNTLPSFQHYQKAAKKDLFMHYKSALPTKMKFDIIRNERRRIAERCSQDDKAIVHNNKFNKTLSANGYPSWFINKTQRRITNDRTTQQRENSNNQQFFYMRLPFINDQINWMIKRIFRDEDIPVRFYHKNKSLRQMLKKPTNDSVICSMSGCPMRDTHLCFKQGVVYKITCLKCSQFYIGSTIRILHKRIVEHLQTTTSSVFYHLTACHNITNPQIGVKILIQENDAINLRIKEAIFIRQYSPTINERIELCELQRFIRSIY